MVINYRAGSTVRKEEFWCPAKKHTNKEEVNLARQFPFVRWVQWNPNLASKPTWQRWPLSLFLTKVMIVSHPVGGSLISHSDMINLSAGRRGGISEYGPLLD